jgi:U2-associated protein SR140
LFKIILRFERHLLELFEHISEVWKQIDGKMKSESFKQKVLGCVRAWEDWAIYPNEYLVRLQNMFLGLAKTNSIKTSNKIENEQSNKHDENSDFHNHDGDDDDDVDGKPLEEDETEQNLNDKKIGI